MQLDLLNYIHPERNILVMLEFVNEFFEAEESKCLASSMNLIDRANCIYSTLAFYIYVSNLMEGLFAVLQDWKGESSPNYPVMIDQ